MNAAISTSEKILDASEQLFGAQGFEATSIRDIAKKAKVNLAAISYHFGGKEALLEAVFLRRIRPVNTERLRLLQSALARAGHTPPPVPANKDASSTFPPVSLLTSPQSSGTPLLPLAPILDAFIRPALILGQHHPAFLAVMSRNLFSPPEFLAPKIAQEFEPVVNQFRPALRAALPHLPPAEIFWRMHFLVGSVIYTASHFNTIERMAVGVTRDAAIESTIIRLVDFCTAGLSHPLRKPNP